MLMKLLFLPPLSYLLSSLFFPPFHTLSYCLTLNSSLPPILNSPSPCFLPSFFLSLLLPHPPSSSPSFFLSLLLPHPPSSSPSFFLTLLLPLPPSSSPSFFLSLLLPLPPSSSPSFFLSLLLPLPPSLRSSPVCRGEFCLYSDQDYLVCSPSEVRV